MDEFMEKQKAARNSILTMKLEKQMTATNKKMFEKSKSEVEGIF